MNRKIILSVLIMLICVIPLSAGQKTYNHDDIQYKMVRYMAQVSNITGPHEVTPVTGSALEKTLSDIDSTALPVRVKRVYDDVLSSVALPPAVYRSQTMMFDLDTVISPQLYFKAGDHAEAQDWFEGYKDRLSLLSLDFDFEWAEYVYGILSFPYKIKYYDRQYDEAFSQNIFIEGSGESYQRRMPFEAGVSLGASFMNFYIGRGKLNMGSGYTGNLLVADNFQYQDFAKLSFYDDFFSYDFTYTHFDQEKKRNDADDINSLEGEMSFDGKHQVRITHSYSFDFNDRVSVSLNEGAIIQTCTAVDLRMFNPFMFIHNWNGFSSSSGYWQNNITSFTLSAAPGAGVRIHAQFVLDQFMLPNEAASGSNAFPNAMGGLVNLSHVYAGVNGFWENHLEAVYTSPYLYLNYLEGGDSENQDFILGYYLGDKSDISYSGYKYGPDTIAVSYGGNYLMYDGCIDFSYALMYRAHGDRGIKYSAGQNQNPQSTGNDKDHFYDFALTGVIEHTLLADLSLKWMPHPSFTMTCCMTYQYRINYNNIENNPWNNLQVSVGFSFDPMQFARTE